MCDVKVYVGRRRALREKTRKDGRRATGDGYSALKRAPPSPPRMIARINAKKRSPYSAGGTGLILCYTPNTPRRSEHLNAKTAKGGRTLSADMPFHICSNFFTKPYGV